MECIKRKVKSECEFIRFKNNRLHYECKECGKRSTKSKNRLIKKFPRTYQFCNVDFNKFVLLLRKGVYPYEYMDRWEKPNKTSLPNKILLMKVLLMRTMHMFKKYGKYLK